MKRIAEDTHARSQAAACACCHARAAAEQPQSRPGTNGPDVATERSASPGTPATATTPGPTRRVVAATAFGALAAGALAACGGGADDPVPTTQPSANGGGSSAGSGAGGSATGGGGSGDVIAKVADIPVGGAINGQTPDGTKVILSQPSAGKVVAFDARCPHQGCTVAPSGDKLLCPCHGSSFKTDDGSVITGPATSGLSEVTVSVDGEDVVAG
jgi:Rieske Fe-S protein